MRTLVKTIDECVRLAVTDFLEMLAEREYGFGPFKFSKKHIRARIPKKFWPQGKKAKGGGLSGAAKAWATRRRKYGPTGSKKKRKKAGV